jgi:hypothetical protein
MSFLSRLFTGSKPAEDIAATVRESAKSTFSLIDNAFYTDQEKAAAKGDALKMYSNLLESTFKESTGTAEARRWFLQLISTYVLALCTICMLLTTFGMTDAAVIIKDTAKEFWIGEAFAGAVSFYFLTHIAKAARG